MAKRPHIILFNPDQMRADALAHLGENPAAQTPFLDALAAGQAASYRHAYCQNPVCVPSRCSFLTGQYPHVHGHRTMRYMLHGEESSLFSELKAAGYHVWMNARNDFLPGQDPDAFARHADEVFYGGDEPPAPGPERENPRGEPGGKDYFSHCKGRLKTDGRGRNYSEDDQIVDAALRRIRTPVPGDKPLCMFLGLIWPHPPYQAEEPYFSAIDRSALPPRCPAGPVEGEPRIETLIRQGQGMQAYTEADWDELRACYAAMCKKVDEQFRRLCDGLKEAGIYDDCAIFFFSDHGDYQGRAGLSEKCQNTFPEDLVRVPLLIKPPKGVSLVPGVRGGLAELVDVYATVMDLAGVAPDHTHFGRSLRASLADPAAPLRPYACCEGGRLAGEVHCDESHANGPEGVQPANEYYPRLKAQEDDVAHGKATMLRTERYKYVRRLYEEDQLFDLETDPHETVNRIADPALAEVLAQLRLAMLDWYQATCDAVPFAYDGRFTGEMLWARVKRFCPPEQKERVLAMARENIPMARVLAWAARLAQGGDPDSRP